MFQYHMGNKIMHTSKTKILHWNRLFDGYAMAHAQYMFYDFAFFFHMLTGHDCSMFHNELKGFFKLYSHFCAP